MEQRIALISIVAFDAPRHFCQLFAGMNLNADVLKRTQPMQHHLIHGQTFVAATMLIQQVLNFLRE